LAVLPATLSSNTEGIRSCLETYDQIEVIGEAATGKEASESLDDVPHRLRLPSCPTNRMGDPYGSLSPILGISQ